MPIVTLLNSYFRCLIILILLSKVGSSFGAPAAGQKELPFADIGVPHLAASFTEFEQAIRFYQKRPESKKLDQVVLLTGQRIVSDLLARYQAIQTETSSIVPSPTHSSSNHSREIAAMNKIVADLWLKQELLTRLSGQFFRWADPSRPVAIDNIAIISSSESEMLRRSRSGPLMLPDQTWNRYLNPGKNFAIQYTYFMIATGLISVAKYAAMEEENPGVLADYLHHAQDPLAMLSFAAFMATNHPITKMLYGLKSQTLPASFVPPIAMAASLIASSLFYELLSDQQLHQCIRSFFQDQQNCTSAFNKWVYSQKVMQLTPAVMSLTLSAISSGALTGAMARNLAHYGPQVAPHLPKLEVLRNVGTRVMENWSNSTGQFRTAPIAVGGFVVFLAFDQLYSPIINKWWLSTQIQSWDFKAWMDLHLYGHPSYWQENDLSVSKNLQTWYIADVLDVEVTNIPTAQKQMEKLGASWQQTQAPPPDLLTCQLEGLQEGEEKQLTSLEGVPHFRTTKELEKIKHYEQICQTAEAQSDLFNLEICDLVRELKQRPPIFHKSAVQRSCEVLAKGPDLLRKHGEIHGLWRQHLLYDFNLALANWTRFLAKFTTSYAVTYKFYDMVANLKFQNDKTTGPRPQNFMDNGQGQGGQEFRQRYQQVYGKLFRGQEGGSVSRPPIIGGEIQRHFLHPADRLLFLMACGPDLIGPQSVWQNFWRANAYSVVAEKGGMEIDFIPPALVERDEQICHDLEIEALKQSPPSKDGEAFFYHTPLVDKEGNQYPHLLAYVYHQLNPAVWQRSRAGARGSNFPLWWQQKVLPAVRQSWLRYQELFSQQLNSNYWPMLFAEDRDLERAQELGNFQLEKFFAVMLKQLHDYRRFIALLQGLTPTTFPQGLDPDLDGILQLTGQQLDNFIDVLERINQKGTELIYLAQNPQLMDELKRLMQELLKGINGVPFLTNMKHVDELIADQEANLQGTPILLSVLVLVKSLLEVTSKMQSEASIYFRYIFQLDLSGEMLEPHRPAPQKNPVNNPYRTTP